MHINRNFFLAIAVWLVFWPLAWFALRFMSRESLTTVVYCVGIAVAAGVAMSYGVGAFNVLRMRFSKMQGGHYLVLGVAVVATGFTFRTLWGVSWWTAGRPDAWERSLFLPWTMWVITTGYMVHLASAGAVDGVIPKRNWIRLGLAVTVGLLASFAIIGGLGYGAAIREIINGPSK